MLVGDAAAHTLQFGAHGTTFGGNPLAAAVALAAIDRIAAPDVEANVAHCASVLRAALQSLGDELGVFGTIRGRGLILGAVLAPAFAGRASEILDLAAESGLLLLQAGPDVLRFVPALTLSQEELHEGLLRLRAALAAFVAKPSAA
jgi:acetylornithine/N-succinyldiaminopimelate aminotransferase